MFRFQFNHVSALSMKCCYLFIQHNMIQLIYILHSKRSKTYQKVTASITSDNIVKQDPDIWISYCTHTLIGAVISGQSFRQLLLLWLIDFINGQLTHFVVYNFEIKYMQKNGRHFFNVKVHNIGWFTLTYAFTLHQLPSLNCPAGSAWQSSMGVKSTKAIMMIVLSPRTLLHTWIAYCINIDNYLLDYINLLATRYVTNRHAKNHMMSVLINHTLLIFSWLRISLCTFQIHKIISAMTKTTL